MMWACQTTQGSKMRFIPHVAASGAKVEQVTITQTNAAKRYGVTDRTLRNWEKEKRIKGTRVGGLKLYSIAELDKLVGLR